MSKSLIPRDGALTLSQKMRQGMADIRQEKSIMKAQEGIVFLLDVSGSMSDIVEHKPKISHLREVMQEYQSNRKVSFSGYVWENQIPEPQSNTDMALGFRHMQTVMPKPTAIVLISDGLPDSPESAIQEALALHIPVNIIYIGEKGDEGEAFMKKLASLTGGREFTAEPAKQQFAQQLRAGIAGLLPAGRG